MMSPREQRREAEETYADKVADQSGELSNSDLRGAVDGGHDDLNGLANESLNIHNGRGDGSGDLADNGLDHIEGAVAGSDIV